MSDVQTYNPDYYEVGDRDDRPWGYWEVIKIKGEFGNQIVEKHITIFPTGILSLQSHRHRTETWVVLTGAIRMVLNDQVFDLHKGQKVKIPVGAKHRMSNPFQEEAVVHEIQKGECRESDFIRYEDKYGRA